RCRTLLVLGSVAVGPEFDLEPFQIGPADLVGPQQFTALLARIGPADRSAATALRLEFLRQTQPLPTALCQQVPGEVCLMQPLHDHNSVTCREIIHPSCHGTV